MKRLNLLPLILCFALFNVAVTFAQTFRSTPYPDRITLTWSADPATTQSVTWRTDASANVAIAEIKVENATPNMEEGMIRVSAETQTFVTKAGDTDHYHRATFTGLVPSTQYVYRVGDGTHWGEWSQFRTADPLGSDAPYSFIYLGDGQNDLKSRWSRAIRRAFIQQPDARFIIHTGDLINRANSDSEWGEWHHGAGFIHSMIPALPTPGNHEFFRDENEVSTLDPLWTRQFTLPKNGPEGHQDAVYSIDYQDIRLISLNSQRIMLDGADREVQREWLERVLKDNPQRWTVVFMHHPVYSTSARRDNQVLRETFKPVFDKYGVDLVLQGHDHTYARGKGPNAVENGPVYLMSVAGPKMYESDSDRWMEVSLTHTQLYQTIHVARNKLKFKAYNILGELVDEFELVK